MHTTRTLILAALVTALCGCPASVTGTVDGQIVSFSSGYFTQSYGYLGVAMSGMPDACSTGAAATEFYQTSPTPSEMADWYAANYPANYWTWSIVIFGGEDPESDHTGESVAGYDPGGENPEGGYAQALGYHYLKHPGEEFFDGSVTVDDYDEYIEVYGAKGGTLDISSHTPGEKLAGSFATTSQKYDGFYGYFGGGDTEDAGDVTFNFDVSRCDAIEDAMN